MKSFAIAALLGAVSSTRLMEANHFNQYERPADSRLFATGMNGDEDLAEDIIMKGEPYHYNQKQRLSQEPEQADVPELQQSKKQSTAEKKDAEGATSNAETEQKTEEVAKAGTEEGDKPVEPQQYRWANGGEYNPETAYYNKAYGGTYQGYYDSYGNWRYSPYYNRYYRYKKPEKVSAPLATEICDEHTTFYNCQDMKKINLENVQLADEEEAPPTAEEEKKGKKQNVSELEVLSDPNYGGVIGYEAVGAEAEKVSVLDIGEQPRSNSRDTFPEPQRSTFYVQVSEEEGGLWRIK